MTEQNSIEIDKEGRENSSEKNDANNDNQVISLSDFLENTSSQVVSQVSVIWGSKCTGGRYLKMPEIKIHCDHENCMGIRTFICQESGEEVFYRNSLFVAYRCGNCRDKTKLYALLFKGSAGVEIITAYKYGEYPKFGERVPNRLIRYMNDDDKELFFKGIACQNHGQGMAAVAYYRRVVENIKNEVFDRLIEACKTQGANDEIIAELENASKQTQFNDAVSKIKHTLPAGLMIDGHNPIVVLHKALSINLHNKSDKECLENAILARTVLVDLVERIHLVKAENNDLKNALSKLMQEKRD